MVLDWGFPPNEICVEAVRCLQEEGVEVWWFDADPRVARQAHASVGKSVEAFDAQVSEIKKQSGALQALYGRRKVTTLRPDGTYLPHQSVFDTMFLDF